MKDLWVTPTEQGLPLPLVPPEYPLPARRPELADDNHAFHPASSPLLEGVSGEALRNCRVQRTDWWDHHIVYHGHFDGPEIVQGESARFRTVVLAAAGYIPEESIDCRGYEPVIVPTTPLMRERLWRRGEIRVYGRGAVRKFLGEYVSEQDLSHVNGSHLDEFLNTDDEERRKFLGHWLVAQAAEVATEPLAKVYRMAQQQGKIVPGLTTKPQNFVQSTLGNHYQRNPVVKMLQTKLAG